MTLSEIVSGFLDAKCPNVQTVAVAVSGGADSMSLLHCTHLWGQAKDIKIHAMVVEHGLREKSESEAEEVVRFLQNHSISATMLRWVGTKPSSNLQAAARKARYALLTQECKKLGIKHLLTAHNQNDQAETFMMRALRGSGIMGMAAIPATALIHEITILRPILTAQRGIIEAYLREIGWPCVWDPSNHNHKYERVKIRHMLKAFQEAFAEIDVSNRLAAAASNADRANSFIHDYTDKMWHQHLKLQTDDCIMLDNQIYQLHDEILLRILSKTIRKFGITAPKMPALLNMLYILKNSPSVIHTTKGCVIKKRESDSIFTATAKAF